MDRRIASKRTIYCTIFVLYCWRHEINTKESWDFLWVGANTQRITTDSVRKDLQTPMVLASIPTTSTIIGPQRLQKPLTVCVIFVINPVAIHLLK